MFSEKPVATEAKPDRTTEALRLRNEVQKKVIKRCFDEEIVGRYDWPAIGELLGKISDILDKDDPDTESIREATVAEDFTHAANMIIKVVYGK